jgi:hypothetical protein
VGVMVVGSVFLRNLIALSSNTGIQPQKIFKKMIRKKQKYENDKKIFNIELKNRTPPLPPPCSSSSSSSFYLFLKN